MRSTRCFFTRSAGSVSSLPAVALAKAPGARRSSRPIASGRSSMRCGRRDPTGRDGAIVWAHVDRPARLTVEYATTSSFANARRVRGIDRHAGHRTDGARRIGDLRAGPGRLLSRAFSKTRERPAIVERRRSGHFRTAPAAGRPVRIAWIGRCLRPGMGHRSVARRHAAVQDHGRRAAGFVRPRRRHDLRGWAARVRK